MWKDDNHRQAAAPAPASAGAGAAQPQSQSQSAASAWGYGKGEEGSCGFCAPDVVVRLIRFGSLPVHKIYV